MESDHMQLSDEERERYRWQIWTPAFGEPGQERLKAAHVFVSRAGGVGGTVALLLAAAGVGRLTLAHAGGLRVDDLNRQLLMSTAGVGKPRLETAAETLRRLNPHVELALIAENVTPDNAGRCMADADVIVSAAPLIQERLLMNEQAVARGVPLVDCAMYDFEARLLTVRPGASACLACLYPEAPPHWTREFPVFGAVSSAIASLAAAEVIKLLSGIGAPLTNRLLLADLGRMSFSTLEVARNPRCPACAPRDAREP
jgi:molybdopterin/thiamine biosynthesis adenylyltransferase